MPDRIDLRSDTVTHPTPAMRRAMAEAEVGDDVFGDDPTVTALEARAAELTGKAGGLFVASGTMGNLVSHMAHVARGGEIIAEAESHTVLDEGAGHAVITGASIAPVAARPDGTMDLDAVRAVFRDPDDVHEPLTALVILENTHAHSGGQPIDAAHTRALAAVAHDRGVPLHVDGARLFNAVVALRTSAAALLADADSATFCLSKGLACPVGSVVVGSHDFIRRARRARKMVGGGMRQVGILAAAGLVALEDGPDGMVERLVEDHENARHLAEGLASVAGVSDLDPAGVRTNFVIFRVPERRSFLATIEREGVLMVPYAHGRIRAVTHYGIERDQVDRVVATADWVLRAVGSAVASRA